MITKSLIKISVLVGSALFISGCATNYSGCCPTVNGYYRSPCGGYVCDDQDLIPPYRYQSYCQTYQTSYTLKRDCAGYSNYRPTYHRSRCCADYWME